MASSTLPSQQLKLNSILVATDLSKSCDQALEHALAIARHYRATLYVVHVVSSLGFTLAGPDAVEIAAAASQRDIDNLINQLLAAGKLNGVAVRPIVLKGNLDVEMDSFVRTHRVDLVVVGTHGRQGMARLLFGSTAQLIAKCCCCPVLTVGPHASGPWLGNPSDAERPLLYATDFNKSSAKAMPYAIALANDFERELFLLHVTPPLKTGHLAREDRERPSSIAHLNALIPACLGLRRTNTSVVESCDPAAGILHAATHIRAVTIVMGAHRDSFSDLGIRHPWSIVNRVNREARCPVLTVRG